MKGKRIVSSKFIFQLCTHSLIHQIVDSPNSIAAHIQHLISGSRLLLEGSTGEVDSHAARRRLNAFFIAYDLYMRLLFLTKDGDHASYRTENLETAATMVSAYLTKLAELAVISSPKVTLDSVIMCVKAWSTTGNHSELDTAPITSKLQKIRAGTLKAFLEQDQRDMDAEAATEAARQADEWSLPRVHGWEGRDWYEQPATCALPFIGSYLAKGEPIPPYLVKPVRVSGEEGGTSKCL